MKSLEQKRRLIRLARWAGGLDDVVLVWPQCGSRIASGTFEGRDLDAATDSLVTRCIAAVRDLPPGAIAPIGIDAPWTALCDRRAEDDPILLMRGAGDAANAPAAQASAETVFDVLRESKALNAAVNALEIRNTVLSGVETSVGIGFWQLNLDDNKVSFSDETYRIHGLPPGSEAPTIDEAVRYFEPDVRDVVMSNVARAVSERSGYSFALPFRCADGTPRIVRSIGYFTTDADGNDIIFGFYQDITEERETQMRLWTAANIDALTGVSNRFHWQQRLDRDIASAIRTGHAVGLLLVDLDDFKSINDCHGHEAGDEALKAVAATLASNLRGGDLLARLGGDEFAIVVPELDNPDDIGRLVERLANVRKVSFDYRGGAMAVEFSIGAAAFPTDAENSAALYRAADLALFHTKANHTVGATRYQAELLVEHEGRATRRKKIRRAIEAGEGLNLYQPIVDLMSGEVVAVDVTARWYDEGRLAELGTLPGEVPGDTDRAIVPQMAAAMLELLEHDLGLLWGDGRGRLPACLVPLTRAQLRSHEVLDRLRRMAGRVSSRAGILRLQLDGDPRRDLNWPLRSKFLEVLGSGVGTVQRAAEAAGTLLAPGTLPLSHVKVPLEAIRFAQGGAGDTVLRALIEAARQQRTDVSAVAVASAEDVEAALAYSIHFGQGSHIDDAMPIEGILERIGRHPSNPQRRLAV